MTTVGVKGLILDWIGLCSVLRPRQHSIGYMGDGFYRSKDPTNSIKVLNEDLQKRDIYFERKFEMTALLFLPDQ